MEEVVRKITLLLHELLIHTNYTKQFVLVIVRACVLACVCMDVYAHACVL